MSCMGKPAPFRVLRDSREQLGWNFPASSRCLGTTAATLKTGDYTLEGYEDLFVIERKNSTSELAGNLFQPRFSRELDRLDQFKHAYLFLEFQFEDVCSFPHNSGIPPSKWRKLKMTAPLFLKKVQELQIAHPRLVVWTVGTRGKEVATSLFKRIVEKYG